MMGRHISSGLSYFSMDTVNQRNLELIIAEYGMRGFGVYVTLLQLIYRENGYYIEWGEDEAILFAKQIQETVGTLNVLLKAFIKRGLIDKDLFHQYNIITSHGIQNRYMEIVTRSNRNNVRLIKEYLLIDPKAFSVRTTVKSITKSNSVKSKSDPVEVIANNIPDATFENNTDDSPIDSFKEIPSEASEDLTDNTSESTIVDHLDDDDSDENERVKYDEKNVKNYDKKINLELIGINSEEIGINSEETAINSEFMQQSKVKKSKDNKEKKKRVEKEKNNFLCSTKNHSLSKSEPEAEQTSLDLNFEPKPPVERFIKPTQEEIEEYCRLRQNRVDAFRFFNFYESKGWKIGKNQMKDWKAAVHTWETRGDTHDYQSHNNRPMSGESRARYDDDYPENKF